MLGINIRLLLGKAIKNDKKVEGLYMLGHIYYSNLIVVRKSRMTSP